MSPTTTALSPEFAWDVFISHASEDKEQVARPLSSLLRNAGLRVWYDEDALKIGDSLNESISHALQRSRYWLVVLSPNFVKMKKWTQYELNGLFSLEEAGSKRVLPVTHNLTQAEVVAYNPTLADRVSVSTGSGLEAVCKAIVALFPSAATSSVATAASPPSPLSVRQRLVDLSRTLDSLLAELSRTGASLSLLVLNEYRYSHMHLIEALANGAEEPLARSEQHVARAIRDSFDILVLSLSQKLSDLHVSRGNLSEADQETLSSAQRKLASYVESIVAIRSGNESLSIEKIAATAADAAHVLSLLEHVHPEPTKQKASDRLLQLVLDAASHLVRYL